MIGRHTALATPPVRRRAEHPWSLRVGAGALAFGLITVVSIPLVIRTDDTYALASARGDAQLLGVDQTPPLLATARDGYTASKLSAVAQLAAGFSWSGPVRWPFPYPVSTSSGFGGRAAPCSGCSTNHRGLDMTSGNGAQIFSIAAGRVVEAEFDWSFGNHVVIEHVIDGRTVRSLYAHMQSGSTRVRVGQQVDVGQPVGLVGATGQVTGPHLHLEINVNGAPVNPAAWLRSNAS